MNLKSLIFIFAASTLFACNSSIEKTKNTTDSISDFRNENLTTQERVQLLINELTLSEKVSLMTHEAKAIERLDIPAYNWWNEGLHGVARSAPATVFPQAIGMAATFNPELINEAAVAISNEGRALYNEAIKKGIHKQYLGLTFWSPNVNIFRDSRWGRGHETYGEDPYLSGQLGAAFVQGIQGDDDKYLKAAACAKHFAVHNGPESKRHTFNAKVSDKDLYETYLPAFKDLIDEDVAGVMCAYNRTNDEACCGSPTLLLDVLRNDWEFSGYVVSDCWALNDLNAHHKVTKSVEESAAMAIKSDVNVNCGVIYNHLESAIKNNLITEEELDNALAKQLNIRFKLGMFDKAMSNPYSTIPLSVVGSKKHVDLTRKVARKSMVLLKNDNNTLPLEKDISQIFVTGNNAADVNALMGNYYGVSKNYVTILEGIANAVSPTTIVQYSQAILLAQDAETMSTGQVWNARFADVTIAVLGLSPLYEGEEGDAPFSQTGGDRDEIEIPENQLKYLKALREKCEDKPLVVIVCSGSAIAMPEVHELADAILWAWYPGEQGGNAVADILFGDYSPSGKLPITIYNSTDQLGDYEDYSIAEGGRTYKYFKGMPLYPFGFGLSYNTVSYNASGNTSMEIQDGESKSISVDLTNNGQLVQDEVVQLYVSYTGDSFATPIHALKGFKNVVLRPGEKRKVDFELTSSLLAQINMEGERVLPKGEYKIFIGASSPSGQAQKLGLVAPVEYSVQVK